MVPEDLAGRGPGVHKRQRRGFRRRVAWRRRSQFGKTEIEDLRAASGDHHVAGFQVAMNDAVRVGGGKRAGDLDRKPQRVVDGARTLPEHLRQGLSLDELHHQEVGADVVERADVRVIERRDRSRFALEALVEPLPSDLDRDGAAEPRVPGAKHLAHAAAPQRRLEFVRSEPRAGI